MVFISDIKHKREKFMENKNVIEVFKKRKYNEYLIEKREKCAKVEDKYTKLADEYNTKLLELLKEDKRENAFDGYKVNYCPTSDEYVKAIEEIEKDYKDKMDDRDRLIEEVIAQTMLCETYEQKMAVYKNYGIVDKHGKIYDYKN